MFVQLENENKLITNLIGVTRVLRGNALCRTWREDYQIMYLMLDDISVESLTIAVYNKAKNHHPLPLPQQKLLNRYMDEVRRYAELLNIPLEVMSTQR